MLHHLAALSVPNRPCNGFNCSTCASEPIVIQWAHSQAQFLSHMQEVERKSGVRPELVVAPGLSERWEVMRRVLHRTHARSILDVGGIGTYASVVPRYRCINVRRGRSKCVVYEGSRLPYRNGSFELVVAETVLHHAAANATGLLMEMVRASTRWVVVAEDLLENGAPKDVVAAFQRHDRKAVYRSLDEWMGLANGLGLTLRRLLLLHRVPLHVQREAVNACELGYAPMAYLIWERAATHVPRQPLGTIARWHADRTHDEAVAGLVDTGLSYWSRRMRWRRRRFFLRLAEAGTLVQMATQVLAEIVTWASLSIFASMILAFLLSICLYDVCASLCNRCQLRTASETDEQRHRWDTLRPGSQLRDCARGVGSTTRPLLARIWRAPSSLHYVRTS